MVLAYVHTQMTQVSSIADQEAREYLQANADRLAGVVPADFPEDVRLAAVKTAILGERFSSRVQEWAQDAEIEYVADVEHRASAEESR